MAIYDIKGKRIFIKDDVLDNDDIIQKVEKDLSKVIEDERLTEVEVIAYFYWAKQHVDAFFEVIAEGLEENVH